VKEMRIVGIRLRVGVQWGDFSEMLFEVSPNAIHYLGVTWTSEKIPLRRPTERVIEEKKKELEPLQRKLAQFYKDLLETGKVWG
jgi:hypothetical protein